MLFESLVIILQLQILYPSKLKYSNELSYFYLFLRAKVSNFQIIQCFLPQWNCFLLLSLMILTF